MLKIISLNLNKIITSVTSIFINIIGSSIIGVIGGSISGAIVGLIAGIIRGISDFTNIGDLEFLISIFMIASIITTGAPLGALIGFITGLHIKVFRLHNVHSFLWGVVTFLSVNLALWFSYQNRLTSLDMFTYINIATASLVSGWLSHKYTDHKKRKETWKSQELPLTITGAMSGLVIISLVTFFYFTLMEYIRNIFPET